MRGPFRNVFVILTMAGSQAHQISKAIMSTDITINKVQDHSPDKKFKFSAESSFESLRIKMENFADERNWHQYHTPRNLLLAMVGEVGELSELFQWRGEVQAGLPDWSEKEKKHLGEELSDVLLYLIRLADKCEIDLPTAALAKLKLNAVKYPADQARGSSEKYTKYNQNV